MRFYNGVGLMTSVIAMIWALRGEVEAASGFWIASAIFWHAHEQHEGRQR